jgi:hypothetical protein
MNTIKGIEDDVFAYEDPSSSNVAPVDVGEGLTTPGDIDPEETVADVLARLTQGTQDVVKRSNSTPAASVKPDDVDDDTTDDTENEPEPGSIAAVAKDRDGWKQTAKSYTSLFPDMDDAQVAKELLDAVAGDEFDAKNLISKIEGVSKSRAKALRSAIEAEVSSSSESKTLEKLFGRSDVSAEEIKAIRQILDSGGALRIFGDIDDDDIPDELKVDSEGNELPEKQVEFLKGLKQIVVKVQKDQKALASRLSGREESETKSAQQKLVNDFSAERVNSLDPIIEDLKLSDEDAEEFTSSVLHHFSKNQQAVELWQDAIKAKLEGENYKARKLAKSVDAAFAKIAKKVSGRFSASNIAGANAANGKLRAAVTDRKEISGVSQGVTSTPSSNEFINPKDPFNIEDATKQLNSLMDKGRIRKSR